MQLNNDTHRLEPSLNEDEIENIINPSEHVIGGSHPILETHNENAPVIEDIVNPSLDPTMMMPPPTQDGHEMAPFSPLLMNANLAPQDGHSHIVRRGTPVGIYQSQGSPNAGAGSLHDSLLSDSILMPYRNRLLGESKQKAVSQPKRKLTSAKTRPAFVNKLWSMVNDNTNKELIHWCDDGKSFVVTNREQFVHKILPKYFKHSNFASFVRQLNMYGWHKVQDVRSGSIQSNSDERWQFQNENFVRGREDLLENIVRQKPNSTANKEILVGHNGEEMDIGILLNELETVKFNQMAIAEDLKRISKDNEMLWKENMLARERHQAQQQALNKILHLLASLMGSNTTKLLGSDLVNELAQTGMAPEEAVPQHAWDPASMNAGARPRLLLKNRSGPSSTAGSRRGTTASTESNSPIQEIDRGSIHHSNSVASGLYGANSVASRISELPFESESPVDNSFLNDLQSNIKRQGESIQELQDWISKMSPSESEGHGSADPHPHPHPNSGPNSGPGPVSAPGGSAADAAASQPRFDLQDYLSTPGNGVLTPLLQEESPEHQGAAEHVEAPQELRLPNEKRRRSDDHVLIEEIPDRSKKQHT